MESARELAGFAKGKLLVLRKRRKVFGPGLSATWEGERRFNLVVRGNILDAGTTAAVAC